MGIIQEGSVSFLRFTKLFVERINLLVLLKKNFSQKLDNFKNLCYNKYVRLRGKQTLPSCGYGGTQTHRTQNAAE